MKAYTPLSSRVTALLHAFVPLLNEFQQARHVRARAVPAGCRRPPRAPMGARFDTTESPGGFKETLEVHSTSTWHSDNIKSASLRAERGEARFLIPFLFQEISIAPSFAPPAALVQMAVGG